MRKPRIRSLVLSAGFGSRLRPLTLFMPKPLLPVCGEPVAGRTLRRLRQVSCEMAVLNTHHLASLIPAYFGESYFGLPVRYRHEEEIQGTYGAIFGSLDLLSDADAVIMINGDSLCRWPLKALVNRHFRVGADATLLLHRKGPEKALGGGIGVDGSGKVMQFRDYVNQGEVRRRHLFAGAHILSPKLLQKLENRPGDIITDLYQPHLEDGGHISSLVMGNRWHDLGTPGRYLEANLDWARGQLPSRFWRDSVLSPLSRIDSSAVLSRSIVDQEAEVDADASIHSSLVMEGAHIGKGCRVQGSIVGPGVVLSPASNVEKRMINKVDKRHELGPGESVMGDLVYTPLSP